MSEQDKQEIRNLFIELEAERDRLRAELAACERANKQLQTERHKAFQDLAAVEKERDAYKRAKAENDDRFMLERDEARAESERLRSVVDLAETLVRDYEVFGEWTGNIARLRDKLWEIRPVKGLALD